MPTAATTSNPTGGSAGSAPDSRGRGNDRVVVPTVPFVRASSEHREPTGIDVSRLMNTSDQDLGNFDVPAYGYVRSLVIVVEGTAGVNGTKTVTKGEDAPFNVLKNIALTEPNGAVIAQFNSGYDLYLAHKYGGYRAPFGADPKASPVFTDVSTGASGTGNFKFLIRVPIELNLRDGLGSLPNQNAAATFKFRATLAKSDDVFINSTGTPGTLPSVRVRVYLEAWDQPEFATAGQSNQVTPPAMNTTQFWSSQVYNYNAGNQTIRFTRVGNYLRNVILVARRAGTSRLNGDADLPDPTTIMLDTRPLDTIERNNWRHQMFERSGYGGAHGTIIPVNDQPNALDNGVFLWDMTHEFDGSLGQENRDLWLPTLGSTRLELQGNFAQAGTLTVLTNDVAVAGSVFI